MFKIFLIRNENVNGVTNRMELYSSEKYIYIYDEFRYHIGMISGIKTIDCHKTKSYVDSENLPVGETMSMNNFIMLFRKAF